MTERLLQFIWQFQYYNRSTLTTADGTSLQIFYQGEFHHNQGPDFLNGKIVVGNTTWAGSIELHLRSSDWLRHQHQHDQNYNNTILHVVWQHDADITHPDGSVIPTLELQQRVPKVMLQRYEVLQQSNRFIPCDRFLPVLDSMKWNVWKDRLLIERLQRKSAIVLQNLEQAGNHWAEVFWWMLARNFGAKVNADSFEAIARSVPINLLAKHKNQVHQLEGLLLGQAGFLAKELNDDYIIVLQREYKFLKEKYKLPQPAITPLMLRMRPANFPTIRLAQLAMLIHQSAYLFSAVLEADNLSSVKKLLDVTANDYWHYHYLPGELTDYKPKQLGAQMIDNVIINTVVPVVFAYAKHQDKDELKEKALGWLTELASEENAIIKTWKSKGVPSANASESQALIELKNNFCNLRRCLECAVGNGLLKTTASIPGIGEVPFSAG